MPGFHQNSHGIFFFIVCVCVWKSFWFELGAVEKKSSSEQKAQISEVFAQFPSNMHGSVHSIIAVMNK